MNLSKPDRQMILGGIVIIVLAVLAATGKLEAKTAVMGILGIAASMGVYQSQ